MAQQIKHLFDVFIQPRKMPGQITKENLAERISVAQKLWEKGDLQLNLIDAYITKATRHGKGVDVITDRQDYKRLEEEGRVMDDNKFYLLMDCKFERVLDMTPVVYHLRHTREAQEYVKLECGIYEKLQ